MSDKIKLINYVLFVLDLIKTHRLIGWFIEYKNNVKDIEILIKTLN